MIRTTVLMALPLFSVACMFGMGKPPQDPKCAENEADVLAHAKQPRQPATVNFTGEWGHRQGGSTLVMNQTGSKLRVDYGEYRVDEFGRGAYEVDGTMRYASVDGDVFYYHDGDPNNPEGLTVFGKMVIQGNKLVGTRWSKGGGACYIKTNMEVSRLQ